jgi:TM2 domain-containing membrane protein YozV
LALFFGLIGIHNFYAGRFARGAWQLVVLALTGWFVVGFIVNFIWVLVDLFAIDTDGDGDKMV